MMTRQLPVTLSQDEINLRALDLARRIDEIADVQAEKVEAMAGFKQRFEELENIKNRLASVIRSGFEYRDVQVEDRPNHEKKVVETYRTDTGDRVDVRAMRQDEMQEDLFVVPMKESSASE